MRLLYRGGCFMPRETLRCGILPQSRVSPFSSRESLSTHSHGRVWEICSALCCRHQGSASTSENRTHAVTTPRHPVLKHSFRFLGSLTSKNKKYKLFLLLERCVEFCWAKQSILGCEDTDSSTEKHMLTRALTVYNSAKKSQKLTPLSLSLIRVSKC